MLQKSIAVEGGAGEKPAPLLRFTNLSRETDREDNHCISTRARNWEREHERADNDNDYRETEDMNIQKNTPRNIGTGWLDRRNFLKGSTALGVAGAASVGTMKNRAKAATPRKGGHLRIGTAHGSTVDTLDLGLSSSGIISITAFTYTNQLTEISNDGKLVPQLAESWQSNHDATEWVFNLRKGVEFHNGKSLDADDVIASINYHRGSESKSAVNGLANQIEEMKADGPGRVVIKLKNGNADYPYLLSAPQFGVLPVIRGEFDPVSGIGTGAYSIEDWRPGSGAKFTRNPNYFKSDAAYFDSAEMITILDSSARQNALVTGAVDVIDRVELKTARLLERKTEIEVLAATGTLHYSFPMRTDMKPFDNMDVRLALKHAVNREEVLDKVLHGYGALGNDHPISPVNRFFHSELPQRSYDPDKAKFHAKKAGFDSLQVELSASESIFSGALDAVLLFKEHAAKAGIDIIPVRRPNDGYWSEVWMKEPWCACYWSGRPTEDWMFSSAYADNAAWNDTYWKNDKFNELLRDARAETNDAVRRQMYWDMQEILRDDGGALIPMFANFVMGLSSRVGHAAAVGGNWELDGGRAIERWWFNDA